MSLGNQIAQGLQAYQAGGNAQQGSPQQAPAGMGGGLDLSKLPPQVLAILHHLMQQQGQSHQGQGTMAPPAKNQQSLGQQAAQGFQQYQNGGQGG